MYDLEEAIAQVDGRQIETLMKAILDRYEELFPEWEVITLSLPRNHDRNTHLDRMIGVLQGMKRPS